MGRHFVFCRYRENSMGCMNLVYPNTELCPHHTISNMKKEIEKLQEQVKFLIEENLSLQKDMNQQKE